MPSLKKSMFAKSSPSYKPETNMFLDRRDKQATQVFSGSFSWAYFFDAAADVYHGVCVT